MPLSPGPATTLAPGLVTIDQAPASGLPVALTAPRLAAASGIATLDSGGHVPLGQLPSSVPLLNAANTFTAPQHVTINSGDPGQATVISTNTNSVGKAQFGAFNDVGSYMSMGVFGSAFGAGLSNVASIGSGGALVLMSDGSVTNGTDPITFRVGGYDSSNERMRLTSTGALGLGTTTPGAQLTINNTAPDVLTPFVTDTFTVSGMETVGEELTAHHGEFGATWTAQDNTEGEADITAAGRLRLGGNRGTNYWYARYQALGIPASPDYTVSADFYLASLPTTTTDWSLALTGRQTSPNTYYQMEYDYAGTWNLSSVVNGAGTTLGSALASFAVGATHNVALVMQGTQLSAQVDGVTVIGPITDTSITAAGTVGFWMWLDQNSGFVPGDAAGMQLDNFSAIGLAPPTAALVQNNGVMGATIDAAGTIVTAGRIDATGPITTSGLLRAPGAAIRVGHATDMGLTIKSALGQSANLLQFQDSNGGILSYIDNSGGFTGPKITFWSQIDPGLGGSIYTNGYPGISPGGMIHTTQHTINMWAWNTTDVVLSVSGNPGHTANLQEWLDYNQNILATITGAGNLQLGAASPKIQWLRSDISNSNSLTFQPYGTDQDAVVNVTPNGTSTNAAVVLHTDMAMAGGEAKLAFGGGASGMRAGTFSFASVVDSAPYSLSRDLGFMISNGTLGRSERLTIQASTGNVGVGTITPNAGLHVLPPGASTVGLSVQGVANQVADLQQWLASDGSILSALSHDGTLTADRLSVTGATTIKSENWDSVTAPAIPAGWHITGPLVTSAVDSPVSTPNSLVYPVASATQSVVPNAVWMTPDGNNGDVQVSATVRYASMAGNDQEAFVFARGSVNGSWVVQDCYQSGLVAVGGVVRLYLQKVVGSSVTLASSVVIPTPTAGTNYRLFLSCVGTQIQTKLQRLSDSFWLNSSGVWVSDPTNVTAVYSVTDTSVTGPGYAGVLFWFNDSTGGDVGVDDWLLERAGNTAPPAQIVTSNPALVPLVVKSAGGQVSDIQQWQDSTGAVLAKIASTGAMVVGGSSLLDLVQGGGALDTLRVQTGPGRGFGFLDNGGSPYLSVTDGIRNGFLGQAVTIDGIAFGAISSDNLTLRAQGDNNALQIQAGGKIIIAFTPYQSSPTALAQLDVRPNTATTIGQVIQGHASQTADLQQWQNSTSAILAKIDANGNFSATNYPLWTNVKDYGAKGDGATDDASAIQSAINASAVGGTVYFPPGTYLVGTALTLLGHRTYQGDTQFSTTIRQKNAANIAAVMMSAQYALTGTSPFADDPVIIRNLEIDGNSANNTGTHGIILMNYNSVVEECYITNIPQNGVYFSDTNKGGTDSTHQITNTMVENRVENCKFNNIGNYGIYVADTGALGKITDGYIVKNIFQLCTLEYIRLERAAGWFVLYNHGYSGKHNGITCNNAWSTYIIGNEIDGYATSAVAGDFPAGIAVKTLSGRTSVVMGNIVSLGGTQITGVNYRHFSLTSNGLGTTSAVTLIGNDVFTSSTNGLDVSYSLDGVTGASIMEVTEFGNRSRGANAKYFVNATYATAQTVETRGSLNTQGHLTSTQTAALSATAGGSNGTTPPAPTVGGNDVRGTVNFGSGTTPAAGNQVVLTFGTTYAAAQRVALTAMNSATQALGLYIAAKGNSSITVASTVAPAASQAVGTYSFDFIAIG